MDGPEGAADKILAAWLRGESAAVDAMNIHVLIDRARVHGVMSLLHSRAQAGWPSEFAVECRAAALRSAAWELRHQACIAETLETLHGAGIDPIVLKGTALAYWLYADPSQRERGDTDLLFHESARGGAHGCLTALGYLAAPAAPSNQTTYTRTTPDGSRHVIDAHWRLNNSHLLSAALDWDELRRSSVAITALSPHARGLGRVHSMLFACLHRCTHVANPYYVDDVAHHEPDRLVWLHDIALLAREFDSADWAELARLARERQLRMVCLDSLDSARSRLHALIPDAVLASFAECGASEATWTYLRGGRLRRHWMDANAIPTFTGRARYARQLLFPGAEYMRHKYGAARMRWLPYLYARRAVAGLFNALRARHSAQRGARAPQSARSR